MPKKRAAHTSQSASPMKETAPPKPRRSRSSDSSGEPMRSSASTDRMTVGVLEAREIQLVDERGRRRASLLCSAGEGRSRGHTVMHLYDGDGQVAITLSVDGNDGASVTLYNRNFSPAVALGVNHKARAAGVTISDDLGRPHLMASVNDGEASSTETSATTNIMIVNSEVDRVIGKGDQPPRKKRDKAQS